VQLIKVICNDRLVSHAYSCSVYIIPDNSIMSVIQVLAVQPKREKENFEAPAVDVSTRLKCILNK